MDRIAEHESGVTIGEVWRLLQTMAHDLKEIRAQVTATNGRVTASHERLNGHDREIKSVRDDHKWITRTVAAMVVSLAGAIIAGVVEWLVTKR